MLREKFTSEYFNELAARPHHANLIENLRALDEVLAFNLHEEFFVFLNPESRWVENPEKTEGEIQMLIDLLAARLVTASTTEALTLVWNKITEHRNRWREELREGKVNREQRRDLILGSADLLDLRGVVTKTSYDLSCRKVTLELGAE
ncbi:hypothetical protein [Rhodopirellula sp. MGV]|uniref:hypothetical protein n=1 Tax=Rhodopirellula sp. MGV TaxID=2023130 RepID=UPI000B95E446|nr:hypothetical protein [Rhodopirellula sp. MGV]OYP28471.1 hypothetical protein CGZ80_27105 [Rhodopirellula sp. MGV]PNY38651.1 hypothetical protein C2E31_01665 [Rhodopirellula baltica]